MRNETSRKNVVAIKNKSFFSNPLSYVAIAFLCIALSDLWWTGQHFLGIDYYQYWVAGQALANQEVQSIYNKSDRQVLFDKYVSRAELQSAGQATRELRAAKEHVKLELFSTPLMYSFFALITTGDYEKDYRNFRMICLFVFLISLITLCRLFELSPIETMIIICLLTRLFDPYMSDARVGNVNQILVGFLTLFLWLKRQSQWAWNDILAGYVLGFAVMFKPTIATAPILLTAGWLTDKKHKTILMQSSGFCLSVLTALLISKYYFGSFECWTEWMGLMRTIDLWNISISVGNQSLSNLIQEWNGMDVSIILLICLLIVTIVLIWFGRRRSSENADADFDRESWAVGMGCVIMLMASKLVWMHYYLLATPLLIYLLRHEKGVEPGSYATLLRKITTLVIIVLYSTRSILYMMGLGSNPVYTSVIMSSTTAMLLIVAWGDKCSRIKILSR